MLYSRNKRRSNKLLSPNKFCNTSIGQRYLHCLTPLGIVHCTKTAL